MNDHVQYVAYDDVGLPERIGIIGDPEFKGF